MNPVERLAALAGAWRGASTLQDPHSGKPDESPSNLTITPLLGGRFVRLDYTWAYSGDQQEGSLLVGLDPDSGVSAHWIDSWHTGRKVMALAGPAGDGPASVRGAYAAPPGPDWGWRIDLAPEGERFRMVMFNVFPAELGGREELAVEAVYRRA